MAGLESTVDMFDLRMSESVRPLYDAVKTFIAEEAELWGKVIRTTGAKPQ